MTNALTTQSPAGLPENNGNMAGLPPSLYLDSQLFGQLMKAADMFARSSIVPKTFQGSSGNCFIALEMAARMNMNAFSLMQNIAVVNGRPSMEAKLITALINNSGMFTEPLEYEIEGSDPRWDKQGRKPLDPNYRVRCFATLRKTGKTIYGPWVDWSMVMAEGWVYKDGSKWMSMPGMMFLYRASSFFGKIHCSHITMGMQSTEEVIDITDSTVELTTGALPNNLTPKQAKAASILSGVAATAETSQVDEPASETKQQPEVSNPPADEPKDQFSLSPGEDSELPKLTKENDDLLQKTFALLEQISIAMEKKETPDDIQDRITKGKFGTQSDLLQAMEDKAQITTAYITGFLLPALEEELKKLK